MSEILNVPEIFGSDVFNEATMKQRLPEQVFTAWKTCVTNGSQLPLDVANEIAEAMKIWATEKGATHYTHWFQPMTGITAEKHDSFIAPTGDGRVLMEFSGKELVKGESDGSSFPNGGLRATFEARGYTAWDPTSCAFVKDGSLYIPTCFFSYTGESLDKKTPLLRSMDEVSREAIRILRLFGDTETKRVKACVGAEQEYFLLPKDLYAQREDLRLTGRTLFGAQPPKGQELDDHYFGTIRTRVSEFMKDLDEQLWRLGILSKTKHNEGAPCQHELAPIYTDANTACDDNQMMMAIMKKCAAKHNLVCLLHEKPFAGVNGSGKHNNWSLATDTGRNLFSPGKTPSQNARFLLFLAAFLAGVDEYQDFLRCTVASAGNDHRLGGGEAPPAIISVFLGDELNGIIRSIIDGTKYKEQKKTLLRIGVDVLPPIPKDTTDRNRTSPLAFTGNKFEFRMLGSSQSVAEPNIALNTIMAEELSRFADVLETAEDFDKALHDLVCEAFTKHQRILFDGNGYSDEWKEEAVCRGLSNYPSTAECLPSLVQSKNIDLVVRHGIYTENEFRARYAIHLESYNKIVAIEARTMIDMALHQILPAAIHYSKDLCDAVTVKKSLGLGCNAESVLVRSLSQTTESLYDAIDTLRHAMESVPRDAEEAARYYHDRVIPGMNAIRSAADALETMTEKKYWPYPTYSDLLFY
ncbi:MAG: glutamine synthetase III [Oscillospiraceae bacterium]|nr:glutamine synthetase III [Oscillospiraceae bacterium]MBR3973753.1 glutamine synthetase III [Oscillospiraceae bacterium]MBR6596288.1 glutamine synthetase III [Oscillospiraceae bacterium]